MSNYKKILHNDVPKEKQKLYAIDHVSVCIRSTTIYVCCFFNFLYMENFLENV